GSVAAIVGFCMVMMAANEHQAAKPFRNLQVSIDNSTGLFFVNDEDVFNVFLENYSDTSSLAIASINLLQFEKRLKSNPFVRNAEVSSNMNGNIFVNIVQKQPLLRIINNNGVSYYLDEKGNKMPVSGNFTARVPVVTGAVESGI